MSYRPRAKRWWFDLPIRYKGLLVVTLPVLALIATLVVRAPFNRQQLETTALLTRAAATLDTTQELLLSLLDVEAAVHGYAGSRDRPLLARVESARRSVPGRLEALSAMLSGTRDEQLYARVSTLANRELALTAELID